MRKVIRLTLAATTAAGLCALAITAATASAASHPAHSAAAARAARAVLTHLHVGGTPEPMLAVPGAVLHGTGLQQVGSYNWSGYADINSTTVNPQYSQVSASWTEPAVRCTSEDRVAAFWVGIDGYTSASVEQDGTIAQCFEGQAYYYTWWEMYPTNDIQVVGQTVRPGDRIYSSVVRKGISYTLTVADFSTSGNNVTTTQTCQVTGGCANSSAEWIGEAPTGVTGQFPLAQFGTWNVQNAQASAGHGSSGIGGFPDSEITMIDSSQTYPLATPGPLVQHGSGFSDTWDNSF
jgi:Peptidase A4 family